MLKTPTLASTYLNNLFILIKYKTPLIHERFSGVDQTHGDAHMALKDKVIKDYSAYLK